VKIIILMIPFVLLVAVLLGIGYSVGLHRASDYDKIKKREYKEMSNRVSTLVIEKSDADTEAYQYRSALESIAANRGGAPEIVAAAALSLYKK
jgi:hypothetical protein